MIESLDPLFNEFIELLNARNVKYLIVGGWAVSYYGRPRYTGDIDIWVAVSKENAHQVADAVKEFGLGSLAKAEDLLEKDVVIQMGMPPLRIDLLTGLSGIEFDACYERVNWVDLDGHKVPFIHLNDLRKNKADTGRRKDLADLDRIPKGVDSNS